MKPVKRQTNDERLDDDVFFDMRNTHFENLKYSEQLTIKVENVKKAFINANLKVDISPIVKNPKPQGYRHKVVLSAFNQKIGQTFKLRLGLYEEGSKKIKPIIHHIIHDQAINEVLVTVEEILQKYKIRAYDGIGQGVIKHVMIRKSYHQGDMILVFVTQGYILPNHKLIIKDIIAKHPKVKTVIQNMHDRETKLVLLDQEKVLYGTGYIEDQIEGLKFRLSAKSFYQVNPRVMFDLYKKAIDDANIKSSDIVLDCYCGIGTISLLAAKQAKKVIGIDVNTVAIKDAIYNKKKNQIDSVEFIAADVENFIQNYNQQVDVLLMDPTRLGATPLFLESVLRLQPKRIVYISCEVGTQVRDLKVLMKSYEIKSIQPFDLFSYTGHVENVTLLSLK